jgi:hypothetical protein
VLLEQRWRHLWGHATAAAGNAELQHLSELAYELRVLMNNKRFSLGFDLRMNPKSQKRNLSQQAQYLVPELDNPISADSSVWVEPAGIESLMQGAVLPGFSNPLHLAKSMDILIGTCITRGVSVTGLQPICVTTSVANVITLVEQFGPGYFDADANEEDIVCRGWQFMGYDVVDFRGLISGLKGCGYREPSWSQLRDYFGSTLNEVGLFGDKSAAVQFAETRGLQIPAHAPFVIVGVLTQAPL